MPVTASSSAINRTHSDSSDAKPIEMRPRKAWLWIAYLAITCFFLMIAVAAAYVIPSFEEVFRSFRADLPRFTSFVVASASSWAMLALVPLGIAIDVGRRRMLSLRQETRIVVGMVSLVFFYFLLLGIAIVGLYLPIFRLSTGA